jgi:hypothetical protein
MRFPRRINLLPGIASIFSLIQHQVFVFVVLCRKSGPIAPNRAAIISNHLNGRPHPVHHDAVGRPPQRVAAAGHLPLHHRRPWPRAAHAQ